MYSASDSWETAPNSALSADYDPSSIFEDFTQPASGRPGPHDIPADLWDPDFHSFAVAQNASHTDQEAYAMASHSSGTTVVGALSEISPDRYNVLSLDTNTDVPMVGHYNDQDDMTVALQSHTNGPWNEFVGVPEQGPSQSHHFPYAAGQPKSPDMLKVLPVMVSQDSGYSSGDPANQSAGLTSEPAYSFQPSEWSAGFPDVDESHMNGLFADMNDAQVHTSSLRFPSPEQASAPGETRCERRRHATTKGWHCGEPGPHKQRDFDTIHDLHRHQKIHGMHMPGTFWYRCNGAGCSKKERIWDRKDNFSSHARVAHTSPEGTDAERKAVVADIVVRSRFVPTSEEVEENKRVKAEQKLRRRQQQERKAARQSLGSSVVQPQRRLPSLPDVTRSATSTFNGEGDGDKTGLTLGRDNQSWSHISAMGRSEGSFATTCSYVHVHAPVAEGQARGPDEDGLHRNSLG